MIRITKAMYFQDPNILVDVGSFYMGGETEYRLDVSNEEKN